MANHGDDVWGVIGTPRILHTPDGEWRIFEFRSPFHEPRQRVLVFHEVKTDAMYRVLQYPRDWEFLRDEELMALRGDVSPG